MQNKKTLISLSLAGAIGFYLYNKLVKAGFTQTLMQDTIPADDLTAEDLKRPVEDIQDAEPTVADDVFASPEQPVTEEHPAAVTLEAAEDEQPVETEQTEVVEEQEAPVELNNDVTDIDEADKQLETIEETPVDDSALSDDIFGAPEVNVNDELLKTDLNAQTEDVLSETLETPAEDVFAQPTLDDIFGEEEKQKPEDSHEDVVVGSFDDLMTTDTAPEMKEPVVDETPKQDESDASIDDLLNTTTETEPVVMENSEKLHSVDPNDKSSKKEFKSIMDFFNQL